jgi:hypothetical protein
LLLFKPQELAEFVHKNAKIAFDLPDVAQFQDIEVDLSDFAALDNLNAEEEGGEEVEGDGEEDEYADPVDDEEVAVKQGGRDSVGAGHDEL